MKFSAMYCARSVTGKLSSGWGSRPRQADRKARVGNPFSEDAAWVCDPTNVPFPLCEFVDRLTQGKKDPPVFFECRRVEMKGRGQGGESALAERERACECDKQNRAPFSEERDAVFAVSRSIGAP